MDKYTYRKPEATESVEVTVPSGNVFLMQKPSKYAVLFNMKSMPVALTEKSLEAFEDEQPIGEKVTTEKDRLEMLKLSFKLRDAVLSLSVKPKIVLEAAGDGEVSVDDITDADLDHLFKWVASGGIAAPGVADFRGGPGQDALASHARKTKRAKAVEAGGLAG